jgi:hypothetical protein
MRGRGVGETDPCGDLPETKRASDRLYGSPPEKMHERDAGDRRVKDSPRTGLAETGFHNAA